ncbi:MAG: hypothetical protein K5787_15120 [Lentisphaeria bacterium]|nr:hypothetical protein [Victivallales bacterium]MCR4575089.1 hypothetical protein [Lentisphaeria bacterium]
MKIGVNAIGLVLMNALHGYSKVIKEIYKIDDCQGKNNNDEYEMNFRQICATGFGFVSGIDNEHHNIHEWNHLQKEIKNPFAFGNCRAETI